MKLVLNIVGVVAVILGIIGLFLPLLPTTPFLLLASACFARSSDKMHNWLLSHGVFGRYLRDFEAGNGIPLRGKLVATILMWGSLAYSIYRFDNLALRIALIATGIGVSTYLWRFVPTMRQARSD